MTKVLCVTEASYLNTGYAVYGREVMSRLQKMGLEVAELSIYGKEDDPRRKQIPWRNYPNIPQDQTQYRQDPMAQFGRARFERACADFRPDVVISFRDPWMDSFIKYSPYRPYFKWVWMTTCDSRPQHEEWVDLMADPDALLTYSDWAIDVIKSQTDSCNLIGSAPPAAASEFCPRDKEACKRELGLSGKIIGMVGRNQRRKLYPELFEAFKKFLDRGGDAYLYCHTSYPDNGWDIPKSLFANGISSRVYFTYVCESCSAVIARKFSDSIVQCEQCQKYSSKLSNVSHGVDNNTLSTIYNAFDVYVQMHTAEGYGMPIIEAAACGLPVIATDYSAPESEIRKLGAIPLKVDRLHQEMETARLFALPDQEDLVQHLQHLLSLPEEMRRRIGNDVRARYEEQWSWDKTANIWYEVLKDMKGNWSAPFSPANPDIELPQFNNHKEIVDFCITNIYNDERTLNSFSANTILRDLNFGSTKPSPGGFLYSDLSVFGKSDYQQFTAEMLVNSFRQKAKNKLFWEEVRVGKRILEKESWLENRK